MGITDEEEGGRTFLFSAHFFCREENVDYGEVCGGFSMQALECFGVSGWAVCLESVGWSKLLSAVHHLTLCLRTRDPAGSQLQALQDQGGNSCPLLLQSGGGSAEPSPDPTCQQQELHWL